jgi:hypothetical protein
LAIRGLVDSHQYIVREQPGGWFITPEKSHRVKKNGMSADAFAKLYRSRTPLDAGTAKEISANLALSKCRVRYLLLPAELQPFHLASFRVSEPRFHSAWRVVWQSL